MKQFVRFTGMAALGLTLLAAGPAIAQTQGGQAQHMPSAAQTTQSFSQGQLQKFVDANAQISDIRQNARQKMQQASDKQARMQIRNKARKAMLGAIKDSGLTLKQYNAIAKAAQSNKQLASKIKKLK